MNLPFANPRTDFVFKRLFGSETHKNLTLSLLNNILGKTEGNLIKEISFNNTENMPIALKEKESYLDILCKDQRGYHFIIEMQVAKEAAFLKRSVYYSALKITEQMSNIDPYSKIKPVIFIAILSNPMFANRQRVISHHLICDMDTHQQSIEEMEYHYVELCNFTKTINQLETDMDKWLYFLQQAESLQVIPDTFQAKEFQEAFHVIETMNWKHADRRAYRKSLDSLNVNLRLQEGIFEEGVEVGMEKGERKNAEKTALKLLRKKKDSIEEIADTTELSVEEVIALQKTL